MPKLLNKLLSIFLAAALSIVPLPVFASSVMAGGCDHAMHTASSEVEQQKPGCTHCQNNHCEDGNCTQQDCSTCFSSLISVPVFTVLYHARDGHSLPEILPDLVSRGESPPLRPPR